MVSWPGSRQEERQEDAARTEVALGLWPGPELPEGKEGSGVWMETQGGLERRRRKSQVWREGRWSAQKARFGQK